MVQIASPPTIELKKKNHSSLIIFVELKKNHSTLIIFVQFNTLVTHVSQQSNYLTSYLLQVRYYKNLIRIRENTKAEHGILFVHKKTLENSVLPQGDPKKNVRVTHF